jgi:hypothetical protein
VVLLAFCLCLQQLPEGAFWGAVTAVGGRHAATASGVMNMGGNVVGGVAALLVPLVAQIFGWTMAVATGAGFALAGAALWLLIDPAQRIERPLP